MSIVKIDKGPGKGEGGIDLECASIAQIARLIEHYWANANYAAAPYLLAMRSIDSIDDMYGADSARSIVNYFLSNATSWRGPIAREVKAELRKRLGR